jgi:hypothetical protein
MSVRVNVSLTVQKSLESVDLAASSVSTTETTASEVIDESVIQHLPIDGRHFQDFATLTPGVQASTQTRGQLKLFRPARHLLERNGRGVRLQRTVSRGHSRRQSFGPCVYDSDERNSGISIGPIRLCQ